MRPNHLCGAIAVWCVVLSALAPNAHAQKATPLRHTGVPQDWSDRQIVFSRDTLALHPDLIYREPRVLHQAMQRWQVPDWGAFHGVNPLRTPTKKGVHPDWNVPELGSRLRKNMFPAKFSFDPGAPPDCTDDYVVFALAIPGATGGQANLVAFNNLYSGGDDGGLCNLPGPTVLFAYNVTTVPGEGKIVTSPVPSLDGTQIAFIESVPGTPGSAIFHVLTWAHQGSIGNAAPANTTLAPMSSLPYSPNAFNSLSSPWIDYSNDIAYVGADDGVVYQITEAFTGTPVLTGAPNWPVTLSPSYRITGPVRDANLDLLLVGSSNGNLYQVNIATGAVLTLPVGSGGTSSGIQAPPIVDVTNGTTFVVDANNGTSAVLVEVDTASLVPLATGQIGLGASTGTKLRIFQPAFSHEFFTDPSTGIVSLCGTGADDTTPWQYTFGFTGRTMNTPSSFSQQLLTSPTAQCTGWTEFFNPNINGGTDFFFFGLTSDCDAVGTNGGCVAEILGGTEPMNATALVAGGPSGVVIDNYSTASQASSIYLTSLNGNVAYKFTQDGLQ